MRAADLTAPGKAASAVEGRPDVIFHLAGVVSGEAELDFDKGYRVNLDGTRALLEAIRATGDGYRPTGRLHLVDRGVRRAVPAVDPDDFHLTPLTSYGTQKAIGEALLADYTRRGFCDGVGIRLPTIVVRPGKPNKAASGFFSGIIREPLAGWRRCCRSPRRWCTPMRARAPRSASLHAPASTRDALGPRINLTMPGVACTVAEQIDALRRIAGDKVASRIRREHALIVRIVEGWPQRIEPAARAGLASRPRARSMRSCAFTSTRIAAAASLLDELPRAYLFERHPEAAALLRGLEGRRPGYACEQAATSGAVHPSRRAKQGAPQDDGIACGVCRAPASIATAITACHDLGPDRTKNVGRSSENSSTSRGRDARARARRQRGIGTGLSQPSDQDHRFFSPSRPAAGSIPCARLVGQEMSKSLGQPVVVENRPGAAGTIGAAPPRAASPTATRW